MKALSPPPPIVVGHPFVHLLRDRLTGSILFVGGMEDPSDRGAL
jgi:serine protease inhibitor